MKECLNISTQENKTSGYSIVLFYQDTNIYFYLAQIAHINDICYSIDNYIPITMNAALSKLYDSEEAARNDIYLLRYHRREFLKVKIGIKYLEKIISNDNQIEYKNILELNKGEESNG